MMHRFDRAAGVLALALLLTMALLTGIALAQPAVDPLPPLQRELSAAGDEIRLSRRTPRQEVTAAWPVLAGPEPGLAAANQAVAAHVEALIADFDAQYQGLLGEDPEAADGPPWALDISYGEVFSGPGFWSVPLSVYQFTGGAHGSSATEALVLAKDSGAPVPPAGLFRTGVDWLSALSTACHTDLAARTEIFEPEDEWLGQGTAPVPENYEALLPRPDGLQVTFQQYQVGPYAIGAFDVLVPWERLDGLLAPALFGAPAGE